MTEAALISPSAEICLLAVINRPIGLSARRRLICPSDTRRRWLEKQLQALSKRTAQSSAQPSIGSPIKGGVTIPQVTHSRFQTNSFPQQRSSAWRSCSLLPAAFGPFVLDVWEPSWILHQKQPILQEAENSSRFHLCGSLSPAARPTEL